MPFANLRRSSTQNIKTSRPLFQFQIKQRPYQLIKRDTAVEALKITQQFRPIVRSADGLDPIPNQIQDAGSSFERARLLRLDKPAKIIAQTWSFQIPVHDQYAQAIHRRQEPTVGKRHAPTDAAFERIERYNAAQIAILGLSKHTHACALCSASSFEKSGMLFQKESRLPSFWDTTTLSALRGSGSTPLLRVALAKALAAGVRKL